MFVHGCSVTQKYVRKRQRRQFKIWDKSEEFSKELSTGIPESNYFAWISPEIYGSLSKQKPFWQCSSRLTGYRLKPIQLSKSMVPPSLLPFFPHCISKMSKPSADSELRAETLHSGHVSCLFLLGEVLSAPPVLHRLGQSLHLKVGKREF